MIVDNPVLRRELLTSLRSKKAFLTQFVFISILALVLYTGWPKSEAEISKQAYISRGMFRIFAMGLVVLSSILAPTLSAGSMTMEKEKKCLDLLTTAPLSGSDILIGKLFSSVFFLLVLIISSLPALSVCFLLGGVSGKMVWSTYLMAISAAGAFGMLGLMCSTFFARTHTSLAISYLVVLPIAFVILMLINATAGGYSDAMTIFSVLFIFGFAAMYAITLRRMKKPFPEATTPAEEEDTRSQKGLVLDRNRFPDRLIAPPKRDSLMRDRANPILEKELRSEIFGRGTLYIRLIIEMSMGIAVILTLCVTHARNEYIYASYLAAFAMVITPTFACSSITQEKERGTFDMLMSAPFTPAQILIGKLLASLRCCFVLTLFLAIPLFLGYAFGNDFGMDKLIAYCIVVSGSILLASAIAMFYSLILRTTLTSMVATFATVIALYIGTIIAFNILEAFTDIAYRSISWITVGSPFSAILSIYNPSSHYKLSVGAIDRPIWGMTVLFHLALSLVLFGAMVKYFDFFRRIRE